MIFAITTNHVKKNMRRFGFRSHDEKVVELFNSALDAFLHNRLRPAFKKAKEGVVDQHHLSQSGGRVLLPSEYFGVASNHYVDTLNNNGVDMTVNNMWIRPPMDLVNPSSSGGARADFELPMQAFKVACIDAAQNMSVNVKLTQAAQKALHQQFTAVMGEVLKSAARKSVDDRLDSKIIEDVLSMKKYKVLRKI